MRSIYCEGKWSCLGASNLTSYNINIYGYKAAARATIYSRSVNIRASLGIQYGTVDSLGQDLMIVELSAYRAGTQGSIVCRDGSTCYISCATSGCRNLDYVCEDGATCTVYPTQCDGTRDVFNGADCPTITNTANADEYMAIKHEQNKDLYDAFDANIEKMLVNGEDDGDSEFGMALNRDGMVSAADYHVGMLQKSGEYNMIALIAMGGKVVVVMGMLCLWIKTEHDKIGYELI